jgi:hypothetical protein
VRLVSLRNSTWRKKIETNQLTWRILAIYPAMARKYKAIHGKSHDDPCSNHETTQDSKFYAMSGTLSWFTE